MQPSGNLATFRAWRRAPVPVKIAIMTKMLIAGQDVLPSVSKLISLIVVMATRSSAEVRIAIAEQLRQEADALAPPHDRLLH